MSVARRIGLGVVGFGAVLTVAVSAAGCTATADKAPSGPPSAGAGEAVAVPTTLPCAGTGLVYDVDTDAVLAARPATDLSRGSMELVMSRELGPHAEGITFDLVTDEWFIVEESDERVVLMRPHELSAGETPSEAPAFDLRGFLVGTEPPADLNTWFPVWSTSCTLDIPLGEFGIAEVALDPASLPEPGATSIDLLVRERACNSGRDAEGRVELVALRETSAAVEIAIGIAPHDPPQGATCPGNPTTPFTVELGEPLGDRAIINAGRLPGSEITVDERSAGIGASEYTASGMLHLDRGRMKLCSGVLESYPPGCGGGITVHGVKDESLLLEGAGGVSWGDVTLTGTYEDGIFSATRPALPPATAEAPDPAEPPVPPAAPLSEEELQAVAAEIFHAGSGPRHLGGALNPGGWVDVIVPLDAEGLIQAWFDAEYGDGVVRVLSWLTPVDG